MHTNKALNSIEKYPLQKRYKWKSSLTKTFQNKQSEERKHFLSTKKDRRKERMGPRASFFYKSENDIEFFLKIQQPSGEWEAQFCMRTSII